ncbi:MAG TPA: hypothetical protein VH986_15140 [Acidimicrobiia bacterium]
MTDTADIVATLRTVEEQLRDLAYEHLRAASEGAGDGADALAEEKRLLQARRAVERAIRALEPSGSE